MKVIVFTTLDEDYFAVHGTDRESMLKFLLEKELITESTEIIDEEEIPESEWDEECIRIVNQGDGTELMSINDSVLIKGGSTFLVYKGTNLLTDEELLELQD